MPSDIGRGRFRAILGLRLQSQSADSHESQHNRTDQHATLPARVAQRLTDGIKGTAGRIMRHLRSRNMAKNDDQHLQEDCIQTLTAIFPDICPSYLDSIAAPLLYDSQDVINFIIDGIDAGTAYTKRQNRKRKRTDDEAEDDDILKAKRKYNNPARRQWGTRNLPMVKTLIAGDFPFVPHKLILDLLQENNNLLFPTYLAVHEVVEKWNEGDYTQEMKKTASKPTHSLQPDTLDETIKNSTDPVEKEMLEELSAARTVRDSVKRKKDEIVEAQVREILEQDEARARGELVECQCCFVETRLSRVVGCEGERPHYFCFDCARRQAETLVGLSKYEITCLSMDDCDAGFSFAERCKFLTKKLSDALDRIEADTVLLMAGIENLETCPFCPFAAECPDITSDREFRCENPECQIVSCRLCKLETHIPRTCEEAALDRGISARRTIEEAMSDAMIRKCNKCKTPFIKLSGCNKMMCTRSGCSNIQCYVCSKSCGYDHFNDPLRGGKKGNCPLFDSHETRHENEIRQAEEESKKRIIEENPDVDPELLEFKMSEIVKKDDKLRRGNDPRPNIGPVEDPGALFGIVPMIDRPQAELEVQRLAVAAMQRRAAANVRPKNISLERWAVLQPAVGRHNRQQQDGEAFAIRYFHDNFDNLIPLLDEEIAIQGVDQQAEQPHAQQPPPEQQPLVEHLQGEGEHQDPNPDFQLHLWLLDNGPPFLPARMHLRAAWRVQTQRILREEMEERQRIAAQRPPAPYRPPPRAWPVEYRGQNHLPDMNAVEFIQQQHQVLQMQQARQQQWLNQQQPLQPNVRYQQERPPLPQLMQLPAHPPNPGEQRAPRLQPPRPLPEVVLPPQVGIVPPDPAPRPGFPAFGLPGQERAAPRPDAIPVVHGAPLWLPLAGHQLQVNEQGVHLPPPEQPPLNLFDAQMAARMRHQQQPLDQQQVRASTQRAARYQARIANLLAGVDHIRNQQPLGRQVIDLAQRLDELPGVGGPDAAFPQGIPQRHAAGINPVLVAPVEARVNFPVDADVQRNLPNERPAGV